MEVRPPYASRPRPTCFGCFAASSRNLARLASPDQKLEPPLETVATDRASLRLVDGTLERSGFPAISRSRSAV